MNHEWNNFQSSNKMMNHDSGINHPYQQRWNESAGVQQWWQQRFKQTEKEACALRTRLAVNKCRTADSMQLSISNYLISTNMGQSHPGFKGESGLRAAVPRTEDYCNNKTASSVYALDGNTVSKLCWKVSCFDMSVAILQALNVYQNRTSAAT